MSDASRLAVAVFAFQRPHYLKRCLDSIQEAVEHQQGWDQVQVFVFQDGARNHFSGRMAGDPHLVAQSTELAHTHPASATVYVREANMGTAHQQYLAYNHLGNRPINGYRHQWLAVLEEDVIVSPHYFRICDLLRPFLANDEHAFSATPSFMRYNCSQAEIPEKIAQVEKGPHPWVGYLLDLKKWHKVRPVFDQYMDIVRNVDYAFRPHLAIREWYKQVGWPGMASSQDGGKEASLHVLGMHRYRCRVNRGFYIGEIGLHGRTHTYERQGWANHTPFVHEQDKELNALELIA